MNSELRPVLEEIVLKQQARVMKAKAEYKIIQGATRYYITEETLKRILLQREEAIYNSIKKLYDGVVGNEQ